MIAIDVGADLVSTLKSERPEVAFIALHGAGGEDGTVQELLEILGIPYTGPGVRACIRSRDKVEPSTSCARRASRPRIGRRSTRPPSVSSARPRR